MIQTELKVLFRNGWKYLNYDTQKQAIKEKIFYEKLGLKVEMNYLSLRKGKSKLEKWF